MKINGSNQRQMQTVKPSPQGDSTLQPGAKISGRIVKIDGSTVTIASQGVERQLTNTSDMRFNVGEQATFEVLANQNGKVIVKTEDQSAVAAREAVTKLIGEKGLMTLDALKALNLPVTQENFDRMQRMGIEIKVLGQQLQNATAQTGDVLLNTDMTSSLKTLILSLDQASTSGEGNYTDNATTSDVIQQNQMAVSYARSMLEHASTMLLDNLSSSLGEDTVKSLLENQTLFHLDLNGINGNASKSGETQNETVKLVQAFFNTVKSSDPVAQKMMMTMMKTQLDTSEKLSYNEMPKSTALEAAVKTDQTKETAIDSDKVQTDEKTLVTTAVKALLSQVTESQKALFVKNNLALNLKNLFVATLQENGAKSIGESFANISRIIDKLPLETQQAVLALINDDSADQLTHLSHFIQSSAVSETVKETLSQEIGFIKDALEISTQFGDRIMVLQMPVKLEDRNTQVSMYVKKRTGSEEQEDLTVLIALDTHQLGEVRCVIEKKGQHFGLHFKLETDAIRDVMKAEADQLNNAMDQLGIQNYSIDFATSTSKYAGVELEPAVNDPGFNLLV
jgi:hypothetical protein